MSPAGEEISQKRYVKVEPVDLPLDPVTLPDTAANSEMYLKAS
jgi:hypothetical protein